MPYRFSLLLYLMSCQGLSAQLTSSCDPVFTEYFRRTGPGWVASDATISMPLPDGRTLWLMGDTNLDDYKTSDSTIPCMFHLRNSMLLQSALDRNKMITILDSTKTGVNRTPVKIAADDTTLFWPGHGFVKGDTAYTYWARYHSTRLNLIGMYLIKIYWPSFTNATAIKSPHLLPDLNHIEFGNAVLVSEDSGYVYFYGHKPNTFINDLYIARCPYGNITAPWEYYNGSDWINNAAGAKKILPDGYVSPSFSVIKIAGKYYLITQEIGFLTCGYGRRIFSYVSDTPYGPFINRQTIYVIRDRYEGSYLITYNATAHPEFNENNEILISYNVNNTCPNQCANAFTDRYNADLYRPKFIRVPFSVLDSGIQFVPEPEITATRIQGTLKFKFDASTSVASGDILEYSWNFGDGSRDTITGVFNKSIVHTYESPGIYTAKVTLSDESGTASDLVTIDLTSTAINQEAFSYISIYPNPTTGTFKISISDFHFHEPYEILIADSMGKIVYRNRITEAETLVQMNKSPIGQYIVKVFNENEHRTFKLIIP